MKIYKKYLIYLQIIANYQGFLNKFHERSSRHVESHPVNSDQNFSPYIRKQESQNIEINPKAISYQNLKLNVDDIIPHYTNLTRIPETGFMCNGRRGMFADVETNCQVSTYFIVLFLSTIFHAV